MLSIGLAKDRRLRNPSLAREFTEFRRGTTSAGGVLRALVR